MNRKQRRADSKQAKGNASPPSGTGFGTDLNRMLALYDSGDLAGAYQLCTGLLRQQPGHAGLLKMAGGLALRLGHDGAAEQHLQQALNASGGSDAEALGNLGTALTRQSRFEEALAVFEKLLGLGQPSPEALYNMGNALYGLRRFEDAVQAYWQSLQRDPRRVDGWLNLGNALERLDRTNEAFQALQQCLQIDPGHGGAHFNLGNLHRALNREPEAVEAYRRAIALEPDRVRAYRGLSDALQNLGRFEEARQALADGLAVEADPGLRVRQALLCPLIPESGEQIGAIRQGIKDSLAALQAEGLTLDDPFRQTNLTNFFLAYHGEDDRDLQQRIAAFFLAACPDLDWTAPHCTRPREPRQRIRIGMVSSLMHYHTIGKLNRGIIARLPRDRFEVVLLRSSPVQDAMQAAMDEAADAVVWLDNGDLWTARRQIAEQELDVLFYLDIGMTPLTYFLAFARLAPVQCVAWGHPVTTGIPNMDYFISSEDLEPEDGENHYSETLVRLRDPGTYYYRPEIPADLPGRERLGLPAEGRLYVCAQTLFKFHPDFDRLLVAILQRDPEGRLVLINDRAASWGQLVLDRMTALAPEVKDRVVCLDKMPFTDFMGLLATADVVLDTVYFSGGNSSMEAFALGAPVVTWPSNFMRGRVTYGYYRRMGVEDLVATSGEDYVALAVRTATDRDWREAVRQRILANSARLFENPRVIEDLTGFFTEAVARR